MNRLIGLLLLAGMMQTASAQRVLNLDSCRAMALYQPRSIYSYRRTERRSEFVRYECWQQPERRCQQIYFHAAGCSSDCFSTDIGSDRARLGTFGHCSERSGTGRCRCFPYRHPPYAGGRCHGDATRFYGWRYCCHE